MLEIIGRSTQPELTEPVDDGSEGLAVLIYLRFGSPSWTRTNNPAINRCRQIPDRIAQRGHAAFARWCPGAARCCSLGSQLRSPSSSPAPCVMIKAGASVTPGARNSAR